MSILLIFLSVDGIIGAAPRPGERIQQSAARFQVLPLMRSASQNQLLVQAFINGKPALMIVDTGSPGTVVASARRNHFQLSGVPRSMNLPSRVQVNDGFNKLAMVQSLQLGALNVVEMPVIVADLASNRAAREAQEAEADGILGVDLLLETKAVLDCQQQQLVLDMYPDRPSGAPFSDFSGFHKMPLRVSSGLNLFVDTLINGTRARLLVDTGAFATLLHRPFVRDLQIPMHDTHIQSLALNLKDDSIEVARIRRLSFGLVEVRGKLVGVTDLDGVIHEGFQSSPPVAGLLGAEILRQHHGIIDFGTRTLYLKR